jgi:hypothetical protein
MRRIGWEEWGEWVEHKIGFNISTLTRAANSHSALPYLYLSLMKTFFLTKMPDSAAWA